MFGLVSKKKYDDAVAAAQEWKELYETENKANETLVAKHDVMHERLQKSNNLLTKAKGDLESMAKELSAARNELISLRVQNKNLAGEVEHLKSKIIPRNKSGRFTKKTHQQQ